jgi:hypothetical protein
MRAYGEADVSIYVFLTSALVEGERLASRTGRFTPGVSIGEEAGWAPYYIKFESLRCD